MKKSLTVFSLIVLLMGLGSSTQAVTWSFNFESLDESLDEWGPESPPVETGALEYDYQWELTQADIKFEGGGLPPGEFSWISILPNLPVDIINGSGTGNTLPFLVGPISIDELGIHADLFLGVLEEGQGTGVLSNITFGTIGADPVFDVTGIRIAGDFTVIPEPATVALLFVGALAVFRKRRSR